MGPQVDAREAYIDELLLNVYSGQGQTIVNIDDLQVDGVVPRANGSPNLVPAGANTSGSNPMTAAGTATVVYGAPATLNNVATNRVATPNNFARRTNRIQWIAAIGLTAGRSFHASFNRRENL